MGRDTGVDTLTIALIPWSARLRLADLGNGSVRSTAWLNVIGIDSPFHETFGYYADRVDASTATLPRGWKGRLVSLPPGETEGVKGLCSSPTTSPSQSMPPPVRRT